MFAAREMTGHAKRCLNLIFKDNHQGQVNDFKFLEILDFVNVRINTKIKSASCMNVCVTLSSKVIRQGRVIVFDYYDILDLENGRIDTKINFVSCLQPEIWRSCKKAFDFDFQGHTMKIEFFHYHGWIPWPRKYTQEKYLKKFGREGKNPGGCIHSPFGRFRLAKYLGCLRVNNLLE